MEIAQRVPLLTLRAFFAALGDSLGDGGRARVAETLARHAADPKFAGGLARAHGRAWQVVAILLAEESFWDGCRVFLGADEYRAFRDQVKSLRKASALPGAAGHGGDLLKQGRQELHRARQAGLLAEGSVSAEAVAQALTQAPEAEDVRPPAARLADELRQADYPALATLLAPAVPDRPPLLFSALGYFLRRELAESPEVRSALGLEAAPELPAGEEEALAMVADVMAAHGRGLQEWLADAEPGPVTPPPAGPPPPAPADGKGSPTPKGEGRTRRPGLWVWVGTLAVLLLPVLAMVWLIQGFAVRAVRHFTGHKGPVLCLAFLPDGKRLASGGADGTVRLWDVATGKELRKFPGHTSGVATLAVSPDGKQLLTSDIETVRLWSVDTGKQLPLRMQPNVVTAVGFTPAGPLVVCVNNTGHFMELWDVAAVRRVAFFGLDDRHVQSLALSPEGQQALTASEKTVGVWDLKHKQHLRDLTGHQALVVRAVFSPDGKRIASGGVDHTVRLWETESGKQLRVVGAGSVVVALAFDAAGERLVAGASGRAGAKFKQDAPLIDARPLRLWDTTTGRELAFFDGPSGAVWSVAFSPDGQWVASGGDDAVIRLWPAPR